MVLRGGSIALFLSLFGIGLGLITNLLLARLLGPTDFGRYAIAISWATLLVVPVTFGMDFVILRFVPGYEKEGHDSTIRHLLKFVSLLLLGLSVISLGVLGVVATLAPGSLGVEGLLSILTVGLLTITQAALVVFSAFFRAIRSFFFSQFYQHIVRSILMLIGIGILAILAAVDPKNALSVSALASLTAVAFLVAHLLRQLRLHFNRILKPYPLDDRHRWLDMAWPMVISATMQQTLHQSGVIILGNFAALAEAGAYAAAAKIMALSNIPQAALLTVAVPLISRAWNANDRNSIKNVVAWFTRFSLTTSLPTLLMLILLSDFLSQLFFSDSSATLPMQIIAMGYVVNIGMGCNHALITMMGEHKALSRIMAISVAAQIAIQILLISYGVFSPAVATAVAFSCSMTGSNLAMSMHVWRSHKILSFQLFNRGN